MRTSDSRIDLCSGASSKSSPAGEKWAINPSVHYSEWANFEGHEFQEVVDAFKELLENLRCENESCKSYLYVSMHKGKAEEMRCNCGATNINLKTGN